MVIEDSPAIALLLKRRLEMAGHSVERVANGEMAIRRLEDGSDPHVVLSDVVMPKIDGLETTRRIKQAHPCLPVALVTGRHLRREEAELADAVVAKPIDFDELLAKIECLTGPAGR
jgi:CheY-like chemotaxis protein